MRRPNSSKAAVIVFSAFVGLATAVQAEDQPAQQGASQPKAENATPPAGTSTQDNRKTSATNDQSGPSNAAPTTSQDGQGDKATHSTPGRAGAEEPGSHAPTQAQGEAAAPFVNGALNVPGAPTDSQTVPAKFSKRNDAIDKLPILGMSLGLNDAQKRAILDSVRAANAPVATTRAKVSDELPWDVTMNDLPGSANDPALARLKYVRVQDRILLVEPSNRIVVGEIAN
ncbi:MAG: hypothetical protein QOF91_349 [Alphaproteobacteria bacterium]|nr:hypothetical protein [Alphaproteobacteria bacterium]